MIFGVNSVIAVCSIALILAPATAQTSDSMPGISLARVVSIDYPRLARLAQLKGVVQITLLISRAGSVTETRVVSGPGILSDAAKRALAKWRFWGCLDNAGCQIEFQVKFELAGLCRDSGGCLSTFEVEMPGKITLVSTVIPANIN